MNFLSVIQQKPQAIARVRGSNQYPGIRGLVRFYRTMEGVLILTQVWGLPTVDDDCSKPIFAFHIHSGGSCSGNQTDYFANAKTHYNPNACPHPYHAGDMPPLFGVKGKAFSIFLTDRFLLRDVIGKTVVIHSEPDDFTSQPAGNSGTKIACGVIEIYR